MEISTGIDSTYLNLSQLGIDKILMSARSGECHVHRKPYSASSPCWRKMSTVKHREWLCKLEIGKAIRLESQVGKLLVLSCSFMFFPLSCLPLQHQVALRLTFWDCHERMLLNLSPTEKLERLSQTWNVQRTEWVSSTILEVGSLDRIRKTFEFVSVFAQESVSKHLCCDSFQVGSTVLRDFVQGNENGNARALKSWTATPKPSWPKRLKMDSGESSRCPLDTWPLTLSGLYFGESIWDESLHGWKLCHENTTRNSKWLALNNSNVHLDAG